jgi:hypothetical protein
MLMWMVSKGRFLLRHGRIWYNIIKAFRHIGQAGAIAQAGSRQPPTAVAPVRPQFKSCAIYGGQNGAGVGFLPVLRFSLPVSIPPTDNSIQFTSYLFVCQLNSPRASYKVSTSG